MKVTKLNGSITSDNNLEELYKNIVKIIAKLSILDLNQTPSKLSLWELCFVNIQKGHLSFYYLSVTEIFESILN